MVQTEAGSYYAAGSDADEEETLKFFDAKTVVDIERMPAWSWCFAPAA